MKLFYSTASPYARKVVVAAREAGVIDQINIISTNASPIDPNSDIKGSNPIAKIPTLVLDNGKAIFDSRVICEFVDGLGDKPTLFPTETEARIEALTLQALGDGILDAALLTRYENFMRPEELRWDDWTHGQQEKITASLDYLEQNFEDNLSSEINIGHMTIACALSYIEFRTIIEDWRQGRDRLVGWYEDISKRESLVATVPS